MFQLLHSWQAISEHKVDRPTQRHTVVANWDAPTTTHGSRVVFYELVYVTDGEMTERRDGWTGSEEHPHARTPYLVTDTVAFFSDLNKLSKGAARLVQSR